jgi:hypothetical protein
MPAVRSRQITRTLLVHRPGLHPSDSCVLPHAAPPFFAGTSTSRRRVRRPPPHDTEHWPHGSHTAKTHATVQSAASDSAGHSAPFLDGRVTTARELVLRPVAASHVDHSLHSPTAQSTEHADASGNSNGRQPGGQLRSSSHCSHKGHSSVAQCSCSNQCGLCHGAHRHCKIKAALALTVPSRHRRRTARWTC